MDGADRLARQKWARWTGFLLLFTNGTAALALWLRGSFVASADPALTAANIAASETLFRIGLLFELVTVAGVIPLVAGLYVMLSPIRRDVALLATLWRLMECTILVMLPFASLTAITLIAGGDFMRTLSPGQAQDIAYALIRVHGRGFQLGFLFLGLGQAAFSYLWWRSCLIPRWLAGLGIVASLIMTGAAIGIIAWPPLYGQLTMAYMAPMGLYEIGLGLWLMIRGLGRDMDVPLAAAP